MSDITKMMGYPIRKPYTSERDFFQKNPTVTGLAADDDKITLNPFNNLSPEQQNAVALNEAARIYMRNSGEEYAPVTEQQKASFKGTAYENDDKALRRTILARILSGDSSAGDTTRQQQIDSFDVYNKLKAR